MPVHHEEQEMVARTVTRPARTLEHALNLLFRQEVLTAFVPIGCRRRSTPFGRHFAHFAVWRPSFASPKSLHLQGLSIAHCAQNVSKKTPSSYQGYAFLHEGRRNMPYDILVQLVLIIGGTLVLLPIAHRSNKRWEKKMRDRELLKG
jgi:hypothetical protein